MDLLFAVAFLAKTHQIHATIRRIPAQENKKQRRAVARMSPCRRGIVKEK
jgi:hypothetical protein